MKPGIGIVATNFSGSFSCALVFIGKTAKPVKQIANNIRLNFVFPLRMATRPRTWRNTLRPRGITQLTHDLVIDLDLFKRYNDEFDHLTGDEVLRAFAQCARDGLRSTDVFGRYGGEEFVHGNRPAWS